MKKLILAALAATSVLAAACHEQKQDRPDYEGARSRAEAAHGALDQQKPSGE